MKLTQIRIAQEQGVSKRVFGHELERHIGAMGQKGIEASPVYLRRLQNRYGRLHYK